MPRFTFGPFVLDPAKRLLVRDGEAVPLTPKAFDTLVLLIEQRAGAVSKDTLLNRVWPDVTVEESNLAQIIFTLRRALSDDPTRPQFIATVSRYGYRFIGTVVGMGRALAFAGDPANAQDALLLNEVTRRLAISFDGTFLALVLAALLVFLINIAQSREEHALNAAGHSCLVNLVNRLDGARA